MAVTIDATVGGPAANSYLTYEAFLAYVNAHVLDRALLDDTEMDDRRRALIRATQLLDARMRWEGEKTATAQRLDFPRSGVTDRNEDEVPHNIIPEPVAQATAEWAVWMLNTLLAASAAGGDSDVPRNLKRLKTGPIELEFDTAIAPALEEVFMPSEVWQLVSPFGRMRRGQTARLVRV